MWKIEAKGFKKLPKVQNIAQSGHTGSAKIIENYVQRPQPLILGALE